MEKMSEVVTEASEFNGYPYRVVATKKFIETLRDSNEGSYADHMVDIEKGQSDADPNDHIYPILQRSATRITVHNDHELKLLYKALASSLWKNRRQVQKANAILDAIRERVERVPGGARYVQAFPQAQVDN